MEWGTVFANTKESKEFQLCNVSEGVKCEDTNA